MKRIKDPLFRAAVRIHRRLAQASASEADEADHAARHLAERQQFLSRLWQRTLVARSRGWSLAAGRMREELFAEARRVEAAAVRLLACGPPHPGVLPPTPRGILEELRQLRQEFDDADVLLKEGMVVAKTPPLTLGGLNLGPFAIELHLDRLSRRLDSSCFDCVALEPNPARNNEDVTHPHVKDRALCAGDATVPIAQALKGGRLADAFLLVHAVLREYNPGSAYVQVEDWDGVPCGDCGRSVDSDGLYYCEDCGRDFCDDCFRSCDLCGRCRCGGCLELDEVSDRNCCSHCHTHCDGCRRVVDTDSSDAETGLCPGCLGGREGQDEQTPEDANEPEHDHKPEHELEHGDARPDTDRPSDPHAPAAA